MHQTLNESLSILHTYLHPQMLSADEPVEYIQKLKQTVRPLASIAAYNSNLKTNPIHQINESKKHKSNSFHKEFCFYLDNSENPRFVYLSYSKINEKWNVIHAIERLIFVLETHHIHTGIQITNSKNTTRENDS
jgi:hypothetical protein